MLNYPALAEEAAALLEAAFINYCSNNNNNNSNSNKSDSLSHARALLYLSRPALIRENFDWNSGLVVNYSIEKLRQSPPISVRQFHCLLPLLRMLLEHSGADKYDIKRCEVALHVIVQFCQRCPINELPSNQLFELLTLHLPLSGHALDTVCQLVRHTPTPIEPLRSLIACLITNNDSTAVHTALSCLLTLTVNPAVINELNEQLSLHVYLARRMPDEALRELAESVWKKFSPIPRPDSLLEFLLNCLQSRHSLVRIAASGAILSCVDDLLLPAELIVDRLFDLYTRLSYRPPAVKDEFGRVVKERPPDKWEARVATVESLRELLPHYTPAMINSLFSNLVKFYLKDESPEVRQLALELGRKAVELHGRQHLSELIGLFETFLQSAPNKVEYDSVRQGVVVLLGQLARYLDAGEDKAKIRAIFIKLLETLSFPSQTVQEAVSNCLPPLMAAMQSDKEKIVEKLMVEVLDSDSYAQRKGSAYGLAGVTKGLGISVLKEMQINQRLLDAMKDKKNARRREGALMALEQICYAWGRLFEPYVVSILPSLLICCGDGSGSVRQAADDCSIAVMSKLSNHGVKLVLPSLLNTLAEDNWRTKCASVELLGSMSYCAPKQLSACLPQIVPKLMEVLTDSHLKVQRAGDDALGKIGKVITNPEVKSLVPQLLEAIKEPDRHTNEALTKLTNVQFIHKIDTASLALIMPVVGRAFRDPSTETRKTAAQIVGTLYKLTERTDLTPYMQSVLPGLKKCLLDPVPDVRSVASKALGSMVKEMGEPSFLELFPWLLSTLSSEDSAINRAGAAQGLAEIIGGAGLDKLDSLMPEILSTADKSDVASHVKDGYLMLFIYLPRVFQQDYRDYVGRTLPPILKGLANENEFVRDTALKAGQTLVQLYSGMAISLLLPELERGLFDDNWRIRYSSVQLLGDLLYNLSGVTGKGTTVSADDDDTLGSSFQFAKIGEQLGAERRSRVLSGLYITRSDSALLVRQASNHVWKVIVPHTPRTLQEIMPTLLPTLLANLASSSSEIREVSAKTLGDIVRKLGDRILPQMMRMLQRGLDSEESKQREGVCLALSEIMRNVARDNMLAYADQLVPTVRRALTDSLNSVRTAAAKTFANLYLVVGQRALDEIVLKILAKLEEDEENELALDGLKQAMAVKSDAVLPYVVPKLTQAPVNIRALAVLSSVAGQSLTQHLNRILPALVNGLDADNELELAQCQSVVQNVQDDQAVLVCVRQLVSACDTGDVESKSTNQRLNGALLLSSLVARNDIDLESHTEVILKACLRLYCLKDERILATTHACLTSLFAKLERPELAEFVSNVRTTLRHTLAEPQARSSVGKGELPGFCQLKPKGIEPVLNVYREGLLNGSVEQKESAALGLRELIERASPTALRPHVVQITGPLIRVLGDRYPSALKSAVVDALSALLDKSAAILKPFLPQLQLTFFKALADPTQSLRLKAATAVGQLSCVHAKPDQLMTELINSLGKPENAEIRITNLQAIRHCCEQSGHRLSPDTLTCLLVELRRHSCADDESVRVCSGACVGLAASAADSKEAETQQQQQPRAQLFDFLIGGQPSNWQDWQCRLSGLSSYLRSVNPAVALDNCRLKSIESAIESALSDDRQQIVDVGIRCAAHALAKVDSEALIAGLIKSQKRDSADLKILVARAASHIVVNRDECSIIDWLAPRLLPALVNGTREKNSGVKATSEQAITDLCRLYAGSGVVSIADKCLLAVESAPMREAGEQIVERLSRRVWVPTVGTGMDRATE